MNQLLELIRIKIPENKIENSGKVISFFDILDNSQNLTEEFLYSHQPISKNQIPVYSTSNIPIG